MVRKIYFDKDLHRYLNDMMQPYVSTTTKIGEYEEKFSDKQEAIAEACERIGKNPNYKDKNKYLKYRGLSAKQILALWDSAREEGCDIGNYNHDKIEMGIRETTVLDTAFGNEEYKKENDNHYKRLYTIDEVLQNMDSGIVDIDRLDNGVMAAQYPKIYDFIKYLVSVGFRLYPELVGYDDESMICGCIDLPAIHPDGRFIIVDWKTNKAPMKKEAGYFDKDMQGNIILDKFIPTPEKVFKTPLQHLPCSTYYKYGLQLSMYAKFLVDRGLTHIGNVIFHITHDIEMDDSNPRYNGLKRVVVHNMPFLKEDIDLMIQHSMLSQPQLSF